MDLVTLGTAPVSPDQPAGADVRYDPVFEQLQSEIDKPPSATGGVDWAKVGKLSAEILEKKSKDLLVASYLAVSLICTKGVEGLGIALRIYRGLLENFWETLFPAKARMRGRIAAIEWWAERAEAALGQITPGPLPEERIVALKEDLDRIDALLSELVEEPPSLRSLHEFVGSLVAVAPPPTPAAPEPKAAPAAAPRAAEGGLAVLGTPPPAAAPEGPVEISSAESAEEALGKAAETIGRVAAFLREQGLANPLAYRLARVAAWCPLDALPPATGGRTLIPPPENRDTVRALSAQGADEALVSAAEENIGASLFWLDLSFWSCGALSRMGDDFAAAAAAVRQETSLFLQRLPGIQELAFADGTPFASEETRAWLAELSAPGDGGAGAGQPGGADPTAKEAAKARELLAEGKLHEAVQRLQKRMRGCASGKEAFLWRVALCRLLAGTGDARHALAHLDDVLRDIDGHDLENFDPELALKGLEAVYSGYRAVPGLIPEEKVTEVSGRIARLDLAAAMRIQGT